MKPSVVERRGLQILAAFIMLALCVQPAHASTITADLNCLIVGANTLGACPGPDSSGTVTLDDLIVAGSIQVTVDLLGTGMKFRDLMLNFDPIGKWNYLDYFQ